MSLPPKKRLNITAPAFSKWVASSLALSTWISKWIWGGVKNDGWEMVWKIMENGMMNFDYILLLWEIIALFLFSLLFFVGFCVFCCFFDVWIIFHLMFFLGKSKTKNMGLVSSWNLVGGWTTQLKNMLVKLDHETPIFGDEHQKSFKPPPSHGWL